MFLYLKQTSRKWHAHLTRSLMTLGCWQCFTGTCVFGLIEQERVVMTTVVHVDGYMHDIIIRCGQFGIYLNQMVPVKSGGELRWYSGYVCETGWGGGLSKGNR